MYFSNKLPHIPLSPTGLMWGERGQRPEPYLSLPLALNLSVFANQRAN